jgi:hypothetical protein
MPILLDLYLEFRADANHRLKKSVTNFAVLHKKAYKTPLHIQYCVGD